MKQKNQNFKSGDVVLCLKNINFMYGGQHIAGKKYKITPETLAYFQVNQQDYMLVKEIRESNLFIVSLKNENKEFIDSLTLSFMKLDAIHIADKNIAMWSFPRSVNQDVIQLIIQNTCRKCGGTMQTGVCLVNQYVSFDDFGNDAGGKGTTARAVGPAILIKVKKCTRCGHSHT